MRNHHQFGEAFPLVIDGLNIRRDLYLLLACALSSKRYAELTSGKDYDTLQKLRDAHEQQEIGRLLLSLAVRIRVFDDRGQMPPSVMRRSCGSLTTGQDRATLTLREACNKIVHAHKLQVMVSHLDEFDATLPSPTSDHMETTMLLHGSKNRMVWRASLDLVKFVRAVIAAPAVCNA